MSADDNWMLRLKADARAEAARNFAEQAQRLAAEAWARGRTDEHDIVCRIEAEPDDCRCANPYEPAPQIPDTIEGMFGDG